MTYNSPGLFTILFWSVNITGQARLQKKVYINWRSLSIRYLFECAGNLADGLLTSSYRLASDPVTHIVSIDNSQALLFRVISISRAL